MSKVSLFAKIVACVIIILLVEVVNSAQTSRSRIIDIANVNVPLSAYTAGAMDNITSMVLSVQIYTTSGNVQDYDDSTMLHDNAVEHFKNIRTLIDTRDTLRAAQERELLAALETDIEAYMGTVIRTKAIVEELNALDTSIIDNDANLRAALLDELSILNQQRLLLADRLTMGVADISTLATQSTAEAADALTNNLTSSAFLSIVLAIAIVVIGISLAILLRRRCGGKK